MLITCSAFFPLSIDVPICFSLGIHFPSMVFSFIVSIGFDKKSLKPLSINISTVPEIALAVNAIIGTFL
jgi:hypothetical protein